jgi:hypothetical protein
VTADRAPDREAAADAIDRFISSASVWLGWFKSIKFEERHFVERKESDMPPAAKALLEPFVVDLPPEVEKATFDYDKQRAAERIVELTEKQNDEMVKMRTAGRALAADLESLGIDSTPVLTIIHCTEAHGGGPGYVLPRWEELKVALQRVALRLRIPVETEATHVKRKERSPSDVLVGVRDIRDALKLEDLSVSSEDVNAALKGGDIRGAFQDANHPRHAWTATWGAALEWARDRSRKGPPTLSG